MIIEEVISDEEVEVKDPLCLFFNSYIENNLDLYLTSNKFWNLMLTLEGINDYFIDITLPYNISLIYEYLKNTELINSLNILMRKSFTIVSMKEIPKDTAKENMHTLMNIPDLSIENKKFVKFFLKMSPNYKKKFGILIPKESEDEHHDELTQKNIDFLNENIEVFNIVFDENEDETVINERTEEYKVKLSDYFENKDLGTISIIQSKFMSYIILPNGEKFYTSPISSYYDSYNGIDYLETIQEYLNVNDVNDDDYDEEDDEEDEEEEDNFQNNPEEDPLM